MIVKLNKNQFDYLNYNLSEEEVLKLKLKRIGEKNQFIFIEVDESTADEIRDWAMNKQIKIGFNLNYELTPDGKLLEELIDVFYIE